MLHLLPYVHCLFQSVTLCCCLLLSVTDSYRLLTYLLQSVPVCYSLLQSVAVCYWLLPSVNICLLSVIVCYCLLQSVAVCRCLLLSVSVCIRGDRELEGGWLMVWQRLISWSVWSNTALILMCADGWRPRHQCFSLDQMSETTSCIKPFDRYLYFSALGSTSLMSAFGWRKPVFSAHDGRYVGT